MKNVGVSAVRAIIERRREEPSGTFRIALAHSAMRSTGRLSTAARSSHSPRLALWMSLATGEAVLAALEGAIAAAQKRQRATARGQMDLFGAAARGRCAGATGSVLGTSQRARSWSGKRSFSVHT